MITYNEKGKVTMSQQDAETIRLMQWGIECSPLEKANYNTVLIALLYSPELKISKELPKMVNSNPPQFCKALTKKATRLAPGDCPLKKGCIELATPSKVRMTQSTARKLNVFLEGLSTAFEAAEIEDAAHPSYVAMVLEQNFFQSSLDTAQWKIADHKGLYDVVQNKIFELCPDLKPDELF